MRVAHITEAELGGVLAHLQELLPLQAQDDQVEAIKVLVPERNAEPLSSFLSSKLNVQSVPYSRGSLIDLMHFARAAVELVRQFQPDILHIHSTVAGVLVRLCLLFSRSRPKIIYCPHSWAFTRDGNRLKNSLIAILERCLAKITNAIVCVSTHEKEGAIAAGIPSSKCVVIENGISPLSAAMEVDQSNSSPATNSIKIMFVGRFDRQKGFDIFVDVMRHLHDAQGLAVGDYIVEEAKPIHVPTNVTMLGWRSREEVQEIYKCADLLLMPSRWEGLPIAALEAMRAGVPVFGSCIGGLKDIVVDGTTGRLFHLAPTSNIAGLIRSTDRKTLQDYGAQGRLRFIERYTAEAMHERMMNLYENVTSRETAKQSVSS
jgi:glycosyltransferase involved in cell wall biosynthesis